MGRGSRLTLALWGAQTQDMEWASGGFSGTRQYARDKRRQVAYTEWWAEQPENKGVQFYTMHPGEFRVVHRLWESVAPAASARGLRPAGTPCRLGGDRGAEERDDELLRIDKGQAQDAGAGG